MKKKAMTPEQASLKKIGGHVNEYDFAEIIGGEVNLGASTAKKMLLTNNTALTRLKVEHGGRYSFTPALDC